MDKKQAAAFATISLVGGSLWIVRQMVTGLADQLWTAAIAYLLSALALGAIALLLRIPKLERKTILSNVVSGTTLIACPYLLTLWAAPTLSPGLAVVIPAATPLVVGFFCAQWTARNAAIAGLAGVILLVADSISLFLLQWTGAVALLVALVATAGSLVFAKRSLQHSHPVCSAAVELATAAAILGVAGVLFRQRMALPSGSSLWIPVLCLGAGSCVVYPMYFWLLQRTRPDQLASVVWTQLVVSVAEGVFFLHPPIKFRMVLGVVVIGAGLTALARPESENKLLTDGVTAASKLK